MDNGVILKLRTIKIHVPVFIRFNHNIIVFNIFSHYYFLAIEIKNIYYGGKYCDYIVNNRCYQLVFTVINIYICWASNNYSIITIESAVLIV